MFIENNLIVAQNNIFLGLILICFVILLQCNIRLIRPIFLICHPSHIYVYIFIALELSNPCVRAQRWLRTAVGTSVPACCFLLPCSSHRGPWRAACSTSASSTSAFSWSISSQHGDTKMITEQHFSGVQGQEIVPSLCPLYANQ